MIKDKSQEIIIRNASELGKLIKLKRKELQLNQSDLSGMLNVGTRFISELENGKPSLEFDKVLKVAAGLGINLMVKER